MADDQGHRIDSEQVRHIALLSRISVDDEHVEALSRELGNVLGFFDKLQELDTDNVEPLAHAVELRNVLAADEPGESLTPDEALANAPARDENYFKTPKVLGES